MTAIIAAIGVKALAWGATAAAALIAMLFVSRTIKNSGASDQRAVDAQEAEADNVAATKARSGVDELSDSSVDQRLHGYQRK